MRVSLQHRQRQQFLGGAIEIDGGIAALDELRDKPAGTIWLTASEHAAHTVLWPVLCPLLHSYPDLHVELMIDSGLTEIAAERFDGDVQIGGDADGRG